MKKKLQIARISFLIGAMITAIFVTGGFSRPKTAYAIGDLSIDWGVPVGNPIFTISNMAPGQSEEHTVVVTNNAAVIRPVGVRGIKTNETNSLSSAFDIVISKNATEIYGGNSPGGPKNLDQFFANSGAIDGIFLANQNGGEVADYKFKVTFSALSGNSFQDSQITFDLQIGISVEVPAECVGINFSGNPIFGTVGNDNLHGTVGNDLIFGFEGNDKIDGGAGRDCIVGGDGTDKTEGGSGDDVLFGNTGNDELKGGSGNDQIFGSENNDTLNGGSGDDTLKGEEGNDNLSGGSGNDFLDGSNGTDSLKGESGIDNCKLGEIYKTCEIL